MCRGGTNLDECPRLQLQLLDDLLAQQNFLLRVRRRVDEQRLLSHWVFFMGPLWECSQ